MIAGIVFGVMGSTANVPAVAYHFSIGCVGALAAHSITIAVFTALLKDWPVMLAATAVTIVLSLIAGLALAWGGKISASSSLWGTAPGAAPVMMSMANDYGADARLVATMQYVRLVCVIAVSVLVSHQLSSVSAISQSLVVSELLSTTYISDTLFSVLLVVVGITIGARIPAGLMLCPLFLGVAAQLTGLFEIRFPASLMACAYGAIGCYVGLRFDRATLRYVMVKLPVMLTAALGLIALCALSAWFFAELLERDYLSVFLATSPGGLDSLSIIALESNADVGLVVAMQTLRLFGVVLITP